MYGKRKSKFIVSKGIRMERVKRQILIVRFFEARCAREKEKLRNEKKKKIVITTALKINILKDKMNKKKKEN